jgi:hypothetical protein
MKLKLIIQYLVDQNNFVSEQSECEIDCANKLIDIEKSLNELLSYRMEIISKDTYIKTKYKKELIEYYIDQFLSEQEPEMIICIRRQNDPTLTLETVEAFKNSMEIKTGKKQSTSQNQDEMQLIEDSLNVSISKNRFSVKDLKEYIELSIQNLVNSYNSRYYAPYSVITQSSGYGKTRSVLLLKEKWYLVYTCLRDKASTGFPKRSLIADTLLDGSNNETEIERKFTKFYSFYLNRFGIQFTKFNSPKDFFDSNNNENLQKKAIKYIESKKKKSFDLKNLDKTKRYLFVFDEASELLQNLHTSGSEHFNNRFLIVRRLLGQFGSKFVFTIFIDTVSRINNFLPSTKYDLSARVSKGGLLLFHPIYFLPTFDVFSEKERILNLKIATSIESICSFGRPLWGSWIKTHKSKYYNVISETKVLQLARDKLVGGRSVSKPLELAENDVLAMFASRLPLNINSFSDVASNMVASNMATCYYISENRDSIKVFYPSEPILAEGAAQLFSDFEADFGYFLKVLSNAFTSNNLLDQGKMGEFVFQIVLMRAWDMCIKRYYANQIFSSAVQVKHFLQVLFGNDMTSKLLDGNLSKLSDSYLHFTHFVQIDFAITKNDLIDALRRGSAIISKRGQRFFDMVLPICESLDNFERINAILIQVKNQSRAYSLRVEEALSINHIFSGFEFADQPQLSIFVDLFSDKEKVESSFNFISFQNIKSEEKKQSINDISYGYMSHSQLVDKIERFIEKNSDKEARKEFIQSNILPNIRKIDPDFVAYLIHRFGFDFFKQNLNKHYYECLKYLGNMHKTVVVKGLSNAIYSFLSAEDISTLKGICKAEYIKPIYAGIIKDEDSLTYEIMKCAPFDLRQSS